jgi:hypothetical protein
MVEIDGAGFIVLLHEGCFVIGHLRRSDLAAVYARLALNGSTLGAGRRT